MAVLGIPLGTLAIIAASAATIGGTAYSLATAPGAPNFNQGNAQAAGVQAAAEVLPIQRMYAAAAQQGGVAPRWGFSSVTADRYRQMLQTAVQAPNSPEERLHLQGLLDAAPTGNQPVYFSTSAGSEFNLVPRDQAVVDFHGMSTAQVQGTLAREMAQVRLGLQQKYGTAFATEARNQIRLSDPDAAAARDRLYGLVSHDTGPTVSPVAEELQSEMQNQLAAGKHLDPIESSVLDDAVAKAQAARGQDTGADAQTFATPLETGFEGSQRELGRQQQSTAWLGSGSTPEDIAYRQEQQRLANEGAFVNGQTPEAQFRNLSAGQEGTTPFMPGQPLPQMNNNAGPNAAGFSTAGYLQNLRYQSSQANPWMAGLSTLLSGLGAAGRAGFQPLAPGG